MLACGRVLGLSTTATLQLVSVCKIHRIKGYFHKLILSKSGTCVPNTARISILAPIFNPDVCSLWSERWEVRTRPLGCHVSTITLLTCFITVLSTFVVIGLVAVGVKASRCIEPRWRRRSSGWWKIWRHYQPGWWRGWRLELRDKRSTSQWLESTPLLA
jgi:hypothetical protein